MSISSHVQNSKFIIKKFKISDLNGNVRALNLSKGEISDKSPKKIGTVNDYYDKKTEQYLSKEYESPVGKIADILVKFEANPVDTNLLKKDIDNIKKFLVMLFIRRPNLIDESFNKTTISPTIEGTKSIYFFSSNKPFFYISTGVISRIETLEVIPKKTVDDANDWADTFLSTTGAICKNDNTTDIAALTSAWTNLKFTYQGLGADSKNYFVLYNDTSIASTKARYTYIVNKYGLENFIKDYEGNLYLSITIDNPLAVNKIQNIYIVIIISLLGLTTLVGFYFISKKKKIEII